MLTDAPPRKANRAGFLESDQTRTLDLPQDGSLLTITKSVESAMRRGKSTDVRRTCADFLKAASEFYKVADCGIRVLAARPLRVRESWSTELFGDYTPETNGGPRLDADGSAKGSHVLRYIPQHSLPRVLPSSRLSEGRVSRFVAHTGIL
jgi:hypothetical protein